MGVAPKDFRPPATEKEVLARGWLWGSVNRYCSYCSQRSICESTVETSSIAIPRLRKTYLVTTREAVMVEASWW
jgi:hypothetical protein